MSVPPTILKLPVTVLSAVSFTVVVTEAPLVTLPTVIAAVFAAKYVSGLIYCQPVLVLLRIQNTFSASA